MKIVRFTCEVTAIPCLLFKTKCIIQFYQAKRVDQVIYFSKSILKEVKKQY